jgi:hypothetical protein
MDASEDVCHTRAGVKRKSWVVSSGVDRPVTRGKCKHVYLLKVVSLETRLNNTVLNQMRLLQVHCKFQFFDWLNFKNFTYPVLWYQPFK